MQKPTPEQQIARLEAENARLRQLIESWGREIPEDLTERWLAALTDTKQQCRKDGTANPYGNMTSVEAVVWFWENVIKPELLEEMQLTAA